MLKNILTLSFLLITITNFAITSIVKSDLVSRHKRQAGLPEGFKCELCDRCRWESVLQYLWTNFFIHIYSSAPCSEECKKCAGCDLLKILPASQLQAFGTDLSQCETFCKGGIAGCVKTCSQFEEQCKFCEFCWMKPPQFFILFLVLTSSHQLLDFCLIRNSQF